MEPRDTAAQEFQRLLRHQGCCPVPTVDDYVKPISLQPGKTLFEVSEIVRNNRVLRKESRPRTKLSCLNDLTERLNLIAMYGFSAHADLKPVILSRIMTAGDHDAAIDRKRKQRKIQQRGWANSNIDNAEPALEKRSRQGPV